MLESHKDNRFFKFIVVAIIKIKLMFTYSNTLFIFSLYSWNCVCKSIFKTICWNACLNPYIKILNNLWFLKSLQNIQHFICDIKSTHKLIQSSHINNTINDVQFFFKVFQHWKCQGIPKWDYCWMFNHYKPFKKQCNVLKVTY